MRLIHVAREAPANGARRPIVAAGLLAVGMMAIMLIALSFELLPAAGTFALIATAALGTGVGIALTLRVIGRDPARKSEAALVALLEPVFDDNYVVLLGCRLPGVPRGLAGLLVGPAGVRALTVRGWRGRYRVHGRHWQYDTRGPRGWITCRTNPSYEATALRDAVARWATDAGIDQNLPIEPAVAFPWSHSSVILEEPHTEVVTADNAPWWAQRIGRVQRLDAMRVARLVEAVVAVSGGSSVKEPAAERRPGAV
jgi:hypothetical protein